MTLADTRMGARAAILLCLCLAPSPASRISAGGLNAPQVPLRDPGDVLAVDAQLHRLFESGIDAHLDEAVALYEELLFSLEDDLSAAEVDVLGVHMAQLALILPETVRAGVAGAATGRFEAGVADRLLAWWRSQDPLPATPNNERLEEHLRRVAYAAGRYAAPERPTHLDDRGEVYVRYGTPTRREVIVYDDPDLIDHVYQPGVAVSLSDMPENEFWLYGHIDRAAYFLFVHHDGAYRISDTEDLLPRPLRSSYNPSRRGSQRAEMAIALLRAVYRQLAKLHPDFVSRYDTVDDYSGWLEENEMARRQDALSARVRTGSAEANSPSDVVPGFTYQAPYVFIQRTLLQSRTEDHRASGDRARYAPRQYTEVLREAEPLDVFVRPLRFLDDDGTTRTELYWGPAPGALTPRSEARRDGPEPAGDYVLRFTALQLTDAYEARVVNRSHVLVQDVPSVRDATIPVQHLVVRGDTGRYHLALQWDQYVADPGAESADQVQLGRPLKVGVQRRDSLVSLSGDPGTLEMSDLKPILMGEDAALLPVEPDGSVRAPAYPYATLYTDQALALYFEVYHLAFDADDRTHYAVEYEVARREEGRLIRLFGRDRGDARTSAETRYTGEGRTAREYIAIDLSDVEGGGMLEVTIRVTDETSGAVVARSLSFEVRD